MKQIHNLNVPETWADVSIRQMIEIQTIKSNDLKSLLKVVKVFNPDADPTEMELEELLQVTTDIIYVLTSKPEQTNASEYIIDGETYKVSSPEALDFGEFLDVNSLNSNDEAEQIRNLPLILSVLTIDRPKPVKEWAETIAEKVDICTGLGILLFFSENLMKYIKSSPVYSILINQSEKASENAK